ncbi:Transcription factor [Moelleriella libera RCEF 2490]|uniref:Transcription factor n=1 Tax=Moelleriella libera RCEF 2490 TaxID=1081109 RepID=A0A167YK48_9HYPO|nr:Transcription factor [Moelleriella libera RCEF 2490]
MLTEDIQTLERYFSTGSVASDWAEGRNNAESALIYTKVPRRREGLEIARQPGKFQCQVMWHIMKPFAAELIRIYFCKFHPAFPILDRKAFLETYEHDRDKLSPALLCEFFAVALTVWSPSDELKRHQRPDYKFVWNLAVEALHQDFLAPALSTICSVLLDMSGRPVAGVLGNSLNNGRAVALARSLRLNRNPGCCRRSSSEKALRLRLWWATLIHDYWSVKLCLWSASQYKQQAI